ncbi:CPm [Pineapple mealybug wilt-associated virus 6]|nr:CPm [Pineapple mealybug wilt-associated virus 6]WCR39366.1 CPm [Pineapple mealybug wilt-associated virus 6]
MSVFVDIPLGITNKLSHKRLYSLLTSKDATEWITDNKVRVDGFIRVHSAEHAVVDWKGDFSITAIVSVDKSRRLMTGSSALQARIRLDDGGDNYVEVVVQHNVPYAGREFMIVRRREDEVSREVATGSNFTVNSWDEQPYTAAIQRKSGKITVGLNRGYEMEPFNGVKFPVRRVVLIKTYRTPDPTTVVNSIGDDVFNIMKITVRNLEFFPTLLIPYRTSFLYSLKEVDKVSDATLEDDTQRPQAEIGVTQDSKPRNEELQQFARTVELDSLLRDKGKAILEFPEGVLSFSEKSVGDERYMPLPEALQVNTRLKRVARQIGIGNENRELVVFMMGVIQLFLTFSTVKNIEVKESYYVEIPIKGNFVRLSYDSVRRAILDAQLDGSQTNKVRTYMRYYAHTTIAGLLNGSLTPAYSAAAKHGVPKKYLPYCFDFALLDSRYYNSDILKANSLANAWAIKLASLKRAEKEVHSIFELQ